MTRWVLGMVAVLAGLSGCASPARYVQQSADGGVVAIPTNTDSWPTYNRREALALIQKHVGPNFEIVDQREVVTGQTTVNNEQMWNNSNPSQTASSQMVQNTTTTQPLKEFQITYRKKATSSPFTGDLNARGLMNGMSAPMNNGVTPAGGAMGMAPQTVAYPQVGAPVGGHPAVVVPPASALQPPTYGAPAYGVQSPANVVPAVGPIGMNAPTGPIAPAGGPLAPTMGGPVSPAGGAYVQGGVMFGKMN